MQTQSIGKVVHYFDKAGVAVVRLDESLKLGDAIKVSKGGNDFEMTVDSMQIDHESVTECPAEGEVAIKMACPTKTGARIFRQ
jgi:hypothetical protein